MKYGVPLRLRVAALDPALLAAQREGMAPRWAAPEPGGDGWLGLTLDPLDPAAARVEVAWLLLLGRRLSAADPRASIEVDDPAGLVEAVVGAPIAALRGGAPAGPGVGLGLQRALDATLRQLLGVPVGAEPAAAPAPHGSAGVLHLPAPARVGPVEVERLHLDPRPGRAGPRLRGAVALWNASADHLNGVRLIVVPRDSMGAAGRSWEELGGLPPGGRAEAELSVPGIGDLQGVDIYVETWVEREVRGELPLVGGRGAGAEPAADGPLAVRAARAEVEPPDEDGDRAVVLRLEVDNAGEALLEADLLLHLDGEAPELRFDERVGVAGLPPGPQLVEAAVHLGTGAPLVGLRWTLRARRLRAAGPLRLRPAPTG